MKITGAYKVLGPAVINFSGGRSSAFMLYNIIKAHDGVLPADVVPIFCNTGKERPETLDFVHDCETRWGVRVTWLEYRYLPDQAGTRDDPKQVAIRVNHNSASRSGEPFDDLILRKNYLPNVIRRLCTEELKVKTVERYVCRDLGWTRKGYTSVLGIRYDERRRWHRILSTQRACRERLPMVDAQHDRNDVTRFWREQPFDLRIDSSRGNCDLCFLKGKRNLIETIRDDPSAADWWIQHEQRNMATKEHIRKMGMRQWNKDRTYAHLKELAMEPADPTLFDNMDGPLDCFCTD